MEINSERISYRCRACRYEFTRKKGAEVTKCPYCSQGGNLERMGDFASKVLDEISGMDRIK